MNRLLRILPAAALFFGGPPATAGEEAVTRSLFNGKDLSGWTGEGYVVEDGAITCTPGGRNLVTEEVFTNYLLDFEFKLTPGANNGLGIHYPGNGDGAYGGMELQILDSTHPQYTGLKDYQFHGGLYTLMPAKQGALKPVGEWNRQKVAVRGPSVQVELNGELVLTADLDFLAKKHPQHPGVKRRSGQVGFLGHGDKVSFRNIQIKTLAPDAVDPEAKAAAPLRVACIGDSITQGAGADGGKSYPSQLQEMLGDEWRVGNFGVSGRTLLKKGDYPYWNEKAYQEALEFEPDVVIIMLGTNDTKQQNWMFEAEFIADYIALVNSFQALASRPKVYVCRPCPVPEPGNFGINEKNVREEILRIDMMAKEQDLNVIDMHKALADKPELLPDKVHPNTKGAAEMAKAAFNALTGKTEAD